MLNIIDFLVSTSDILSAGIAITAFSLLLYALTFNLRERVARVFAALLLGVTMVYFCDAVVGTTSGAAVNVWLRLQWIGIAFIPAAYLHFSDALLLTTGLPSRWRRRLGIRLLYLAGSAFLLAATFSNALVTNPVVDSGAAHLQAGPLFPVFIAYFLGSLAWAAWNFTRAYRRTQTSTARRRMLYLMTSAAAPALGTFPFLLLSGRPAAIHPLIFWSIVLVTNLAVTLLLVVMAYAVAYYGVTQPDRVIKGRLFQWLLRGPFVASAVLAVYALANRYGPSVPGYDDRAHPILIIAVLLVLQYTISIIRLPIERVLFYGVERGELRRLQILEERLLTSADLRQFLESVLASLCDSLRCPAAFVAAFNDDGKLEYEVSLGADAPPRSQNELPPYTELRAARFSAPGANGHSKALIESGMFEWGDYRIVPLRSEALEAPLGLLGWLAPPEPLTPEQIGALVTFTRRAAAALEDRRLQQEVFKAVDHLLPQIEAIQRMRATANASGAQSLAPAPDSIIDSPDLPAMIKNALSHYWGGPKLTDSPLMRLRIVKQALREHNGNATNALRAVLQQAIDRIKPEGQRKFTADWILYNILDMKFLQNRRVREVALRLAVSEADLYRKQRAAIEQVAQAIVEMEREAAERATDYDIAG
jgi:N-terminal 7TM region of histidine kinase